MLTIAGLGLCCWLSTQGAAIAPAPDESVAAMSETDPQRVEPKSRGPRQLVEFSGLFGRERRGKNEGLGGFRVGYARYLQERVSLRMGLSGWYLRDIGSDGLGVALDSGVRFEQSIGDKTAIFGQALGGMLFSTHNFPASGTQYNFFYEGSVGCSRQIQGPWSVEVALGFTHISNGFFWGRSRNPGTNNWSGHVGISYDF